MDIEGTEQSVYITPVHIYWALLSFFISIHFYSEFAAARKHMFLEV